MKQSSEFSLRKLSFRTKINILTLRNRCLNFSAFCWAFRTSWWVSSENPFEIFATFHEWLNFWHGIDPIHVFSDVLVVCHHFLQRNWCHFIASYNNTSAIVVASPVKNILFPKKLDSCCNFTLVALTWPSLRASLWKYSKMILLYNLLIEISYINTQSGL